MRPRPIKGPKRLKRESGQSLVASHACVAFPRSVPHPRGVDTAGLDSRPNVGMRRKIRRRLFGRAQGRDGLPMRAGRGPHVAQGGTRQRRSIPGWLVGAPTGADGGWLRPIDPRPKGVMRRKGSARLQLRSPRSLVSPAQGPTLARRTPPVDVSLYGRSGAKAGNLLVPARALRVQPARPGDAPLQFAVTAAEPAPSQLWPTRSAGRASLRRT